MTIGTRRSGAAESAESAESPAPLEPGSEAATLPGDDDGRRRAVIEDVRPRVDEGRFPIKRIVGDRVLVEADAYIDGHDVVEVRLLYRQADDAAWTEVEMLGPDNDRWAADFEVDRIGRWQYAILAWADRFSSWHRDLRTRLEAGQDVAVELLIGADLADGAAERARDAGAADDARTLLDWAAALRSPSEAGPVMGASTEAMPMAAEPGRSATSATAEVATIALDEVAVAAAHRHPDRRFATTSDPVLDLVVDPVRARFSAWYELFPRSASPDPARPGTFRDVIARLDYIAELGFDVLYLPPIHPIGRTFRKGPNNTESTNESDVGVPWAIGGEGGGHTAINVALGTMDDFRALVVAAATRDIDIALDIAFQASPDHPWVTEHPNWFRARPDGTIQYAENPPKKYQDIYPFDFESADWRSLWQALADVFEYWIAHGVTIFRVDNPHTKSFAFWEWCIAAIKRDHPEVLFLAEAFTRPKPKYRLAKLGFSQSYTYFTWRNTARELAEYVTELTSTEVREFFRPNFWPNTPDILHADLQGGGRAAAQARFVLAATLSSNYGIYGPVFELGVNTAREPGSEEYLDSEKYQQRTWNLDDPLSLRQLIATVNRARRAHPALQYTDEVRLHTIDNGHLLAYSKHHGEDAVLIVVSLDPRNVQGGRLELDPAVFGLDPDGALDLLDLLSGDRHRWRRGQWVGIDPSRNPALLLVRADDEADR